jgi:hypothetical protein
MRGTSKNEGWAFFVAVVLLLASPALSKIQLTVDYGWNERFRLGKWAPLYITVSDSSPREVMLRIDAPTDRRYAMKIYERLAIGPTPKVIPLFTPLSYRLDETTVSVLDPISHRLLESTVLSRDFAGGVDRGPPDDTNQFIALSGSTQGERLLETQLTGDRVTTSFLAAARLPETAIGYDSLDLLILNQPDIGRMSVEQQRAIAEWVRAGGLLVLWPSAGPMPTSGPLVEIMPASVGENEVLQLDASAVKAAGLPARFAALPGRKLSDPAPSAKRVALLTETGPAGYRHWVGFGQVMLLPADVSQLVFDDPAKAHAFWKQILRDMLLLTEKEPEGKPPIRPISVVNPGSTEHIFDWLGDVPGAGSFGFSYVAMILIAMMFVVGPVDWFVLKWLGRQPWTWITTAGWIGLITLSGIYIGRIFKSGDVHYRSVTLIDEAGGSRVAKLNLAAIYSPQTAEYDVQVDPESWWRPASQTITFSNSPVRTEIPFHQDYRGNRPLELLINVWNLRFLEGAQFTPAAPIIDAKLTRSGNTIAGKITNRGAAVLGDVRIRAGDRIAGFAGTIAPGATLEGSATLESYAPIAPSRTNTQEPTTRPTAVSLAPAAAVQSARIDQVLRNRADIAAVTAMYEAPPEGMSLKVDVMKESHVGVVRALVPLE